MQLKLSNPLRSMFVTQYFGNKNPSLYGNAGHNGLDFSAKHGTPIYAAHNGYAYYQIDDKGGHGIVIFTDAEYESTTGELSYWKTIYWHLVDPLKEPRYRSPVMDKIGMKVKTGDLIGYADNTGHSTGDHLHFGLKPVAKGEDKATWYNVNQDNGYYGAVDPVPYMDLPEFTRWMKRGDVNDDVRKMQAFFLRNKYMTPITSGFGVYGPRTQSAVRQFQMDNGIPHNNGYQAGPQTIAKLTELIRNNK